MMKHLLILGAVCALGLAGCASKGGGAMESGQTPPPAGAEGEVPFIPPLPGANGA